MLNRLVISNFAIIEDADVTLKDGFSVFTGETGAGKSLLFDSIRLLFGVRASTELIRKGKDKATIKGYFSTRHPYAVSYLDNLGVNPNEFVIMRVISPTNSYCKINDISVSLNDLKKLTVYLLDIHEQFDVVKLFNKENYLSMVDAYKNELISEYLEKYTALLKDFRLAKQDYESTLKNINDIKAKRDIYEYELKELQGFHLQENEEEEITERINFLNNYETIYEDFNEIKDVNLDDVYKLLKNLEQLSEYQSQYEEPSRKVNDYYYDLVDIIDGIKKDSRHLDYDPNELNELTVRLNEYKSLKKKYHKEVNELIEYQKHLEELLLSEEDYDVLLNEKKTALIKAYDDAYTAGLDLSNVRNSLAREMEKEIISSLSDLALSVKFEIVVKPRDKEDDYQGNIFFADGLDEIDFNIETNKGEGLKPLEKVVSGGEASRIYLAFKILYIKVHKIETVVFDEIDTGISGEIAQKVASKIYALSLSHQVLSITHLPQVAALSKHHLLVSKVVKDERTYVNIKELTLDEKIYEIASLISGNKVTDKQLEYAKELILNR